MFKKLPLIIVAMMFVFAAAIAACSVPPASAQNSTQPAVTEASASSTAGTSAAMFDVVLADGTHFAVTADLLATLPESSVTFNGDSFKGVKLSDVLAAAGVTQYNELVFTGSSTYTVRPERVSDRFLLHLTDKGTYEMATPVIPLSNLVKDITTIEVK